ncbi:MAG: zeta toxin family protein [Rickettsiales bacterium]
MTSSHSDKVRGKRPKADPWWRMNPEKYNLPSWADHCEEGLPHSSVMEIGTATGEDYPYFRAVLKPERVFLQYLVAQTICNASITDKAHLEAIVGRMYKERLNDFRIAFEEEGAIEPDSLEERKRLAEEFFDHKKMSKPYTVKDISTNSQYDHISSSQIDEMVESLRESGFDGTENEARAIVCGHLKSIEMFEDEDYAEYNFEEVKQTLASFEQTYDKILLTIGKGYMPGSIDTGNLAGFKDIFVAAVTNDWVQKKREAFAKGFAKKAINEEIDAGHLKGLEPVAAKDRHNTVITGNIASGKTTLLARLERKGEVNRKNSIMIDIDEFRDLENIVGNDMSDVDFIAHPNSKHENKEKDAGLRAHEECHQIRRKILDIIDEKTKADQSPNVVVMTALVSPRMRKWLTDGNPNTKVYMLYNDPDTALKNAYDRQNLIDRSVSTRRVLASNKNTADALHYIFCVETERGNNLSLEVIDTTDATVTDGKSGAIMKGDKVVVRADSEHKVHIYDIDRFRRIYEGRYIDVDAKRPDKKKLYKFLPEAESLEKNYRLLFRPHEITFHARKGQRDLEATKPAGSDQITDGYFHTVMQSAPGLKSIYSGVPSTERSL